MQRALEPRWDVRGDARENEGRIYTTKIGIEHD